MKKNYLLTIISIVALLALIVILMVSSIDDGDSGTMSDDSSNKVEVPDTVNKCYTTPAIGNIYLGTTLKEFNKQKEKFLSSTPELADLRIVEIKPLLYNGRVERILIRSERHSYNINFVSEFPYWVGLYNRKYGETEPYEERIINGKRYYISDSKYGEPYKGHEFLFENEDVYAVINGAKEKVAPAYLLESHTRLNNAYSLIDISNAKLYKEAINAANKNIKEKEKKDLETI